MKSKLAICFVIGTLLMPVLTTAADSDSDRATPSSERVDPNPDRPNPDRAQPSSEREPPMTFVKDSVITAKIKARLATEKISSLARIRVDTTQQGVVMLRGTVKTQEEADRAAAIAREIEGVTSVTNQIQLRP